MQRVEFLNTASMVRMVPSSRKHLDFSSGDAYLVCKFSDMLLTGRCSL